MGQFYWHRFGAPVVWATGFATAAFQVAFFFVLRLCGVAVGTMLGIGSSLIAAGVLLRSETEPYLVVFCGDRFDRSGADGFAVGRSVELVGPLFGADQWLIFRADWSGLEENESSRLCRSGAQHVNFADSRVVALACGVAGC